MDSMRNLHTSLPSEDSPRRQRKTKIARPSGSLIEAFRAAATSVTNLYKTSLNDQNTIYESGYQDALSELLVFLDKENLGVGDGEGWRIRQWATERFLGSGSPEASAGESEEEEEQRARSSSPVKEEEPKDDNRAATAPPAVASASPLVELVSEPDSFLERQRHDRLVPPSRVDFTFQTSHSYPTVTDVDMNSSETTSPIHPPSRSRNHRNTRNNNRTSNRNTQASVQLGPGAGVKRKTTFPDFFNLQNFPGSDRDGGAGGKRGRFV